MLLRPLFRHDAFRQAWVLRGIGDTRGPVLTSRERKTIAQADPSRQSTPGQGLRVWPPTGFGMHTAALSASVLVAAVLGFTVSGAIGHGQPLPTLDEHAVAGPIRISFPSGWRRQSPTAKGQLDLSDELVLSPARHAGGTLLIGTAATADPSLLPHSLLATLPRPPRAQLVNLGSETFYRYPDLPLNGGKSASVYALPSSDGTVLGVCLRRRYSDFSSSCERILRTIKPSSGRLAVGLEPIYGSALGAVIAKLNALRSSLGSQLSHAQDAGAQASAENALAAAHLTAASALLRLNAGPASGANSALASALQMTAEAYGALAPATTRGDANAYSAATASLSRATSALDSAYGELQRLGYRVG